MDRYTLEIEETFLAEAENAEYPMWVRLCEIRFPWDDYHFHTRRFFVVRKREMDGSCWDHIHRNLRDALSDFGKEANRKARYGDGHTEKEYGRVKYCDDWWVYRNELIEYDDRYVPSSSAGDYSPSCPWNAPGMSVRDFI